MNVFSQTIENCMENVIDLKKKQLKTFCTVSDELKINYYSNDGEFWDIITHDEDLLKILGINMMSRVKSNENHNSAELRTRKV